MSLLFYQLELIFSALIYSIIIVGIGIPLFYVLFYVLKKKGREVSKKVKNSISIFVPLLVAIFVSIYVWREPYHDSKYILGDVEVPIRIMSVEYPNEGNIADDFQVVKQFKVKKNKRVKCKEQIDAIIEKDTRWTKDGNIYVYDETIFENETHLVVTLDFTTGKGVFNLLRW